MDLKVILDDYNKNEKNGGIPRLTAQGTDIIEIFQTAEIYEKAIKFLKENNIKLSAEEYRNKFLTSLSEEDKNKFDKIFVNGIIKNNSSEKKFILPYICGILSKNDDEYGLSLEDNALPTDLFNTIKTKCNKNYYEIKSYQEEYFQCFLNIKLKNSSHSFLKIIVETLKTNFELNFHISKEEFYVCLIPFLFNNKNLDFTSCVESLSECILMHRNKKNSNSYTENEEILIKEIVKQASLNARYWNIFALNLHQHYDCDVFSIGSTSVGETKDINEINCLMLNKNLIKGDVDLTKEKTQFELFPFEIKKHSDLYDFSINNNIFPQKFLYENQNEHYLDSVCHKNIILFSNPNSGKSIFVKETILEQYKKSNIPYYHKEISVEPDEFNLPGKLLMHSDINGNVIYGSLFETVINAIINFKTPHINYFDEMGEQSFKLLFGKLKNILKNNNRVSLDKIYQQVQDKTLFLTKLKSIKCIYSLNDFIETYKSYIGVSNILNIKINNQDISFFLPSNYLFIGTSNYSAPIKQSLNKTDGFAENGGRFKTIHFYQGVNDYDFGLVLPKFIITFNKKVLNCFNDFLKKEEYVERDILKQIEEVKYQCLLSNFEQIDEDLNKAKKIVFSNLEEHTTINIDDINELVNSINKVKIDD